MSREIIALNLFLPVRLHLPGLHLYLTALVYTMGQISYLLNN